MPDGSITRSRWESRGAHEILQPPAQPVRETGSGDGTPEESAGSAAQLEGFLESTSDAIFAVDRAYRYLLFNSNHAAVMRALYDKDIRRGESLLECLTVAEDREKARRHIDRALCGERVVETAFSGEEHLTRSCFEVIHNPIRDPQGTVVGVAICGRDITQERRSLEAREQALAEARRRTTDLEALFVGAKAVLEEEHYLSAARRIFDCARQVTGAPAGYVALLSATGEENQVLFLEAGDLPCSVDPSLPMPVRGLRAEAYHTGRAVADNDFVRSSWASLMPAGHVALRNVLFAPLNLDGTTVGIMGLANKPTDFTQDDRRMAEALGQLAAIALRNHRQRDALRESEAKFRALFEELKDGISLTHQGVLVDANPQMAQMLGLEEREALKGKSLLDLMTPESRARALEEIKGIHSGQIRMSTAEFSYCRPDGSTVTTEMRGSKVVIDGKVHGLSVHRDITERKLAEAEHRELQGQLLQAQKMEAVGQLAGGIAHDFNNILAAMILQLNMLRLEPEIPPAAVHQAVDELLASADRAADLTRQLLLFSRRQVMKRSRHDVNAIVRELTKLLERLLGEQIALAVDLSELPLWVEGDAGMIEQVVLNLCVNARDAMPKGGRLTITTRPMVLDDEAAKRTPAARPGRFACLSVADTGCGIEAAVLPHIFEPFFTTKAPGAGTGLGLSTVHGIVGKHAGWIEVASQPGQGSTFAVVLPSAPQVHATLEHTAPAPLEGGTEHVLIVEDDPHVLRAAVRCLQQLGYRVSAATNGLEALSIWEQQRGEFDMLFADMVMPGGLSGIDLSTRFKAQKENLKTIIATGYSTELLDNDGNAVPGLVQLPKPYSFTSLAKTIRECLDGQA